MRTAREQCESNVYHVIARGVGRQILFEDDVDRRFFLATLAEQRDAKGVELYAWCLMSNHVHLLFRGPLGDISEMMKALESRYANRFNRRHSRAGTLFQGRFTSVAVLTDEQLLQAVRYVHRNPLSSDGIIEGPWSSYRDYLGHKGPIVVDTAFVLALFGGRDSFRVFHECESEEYAIMLPRHRLTDAEALSVAKKILGDVGPYGLKALDAQSRDAFLVKLRRAGLSARQISRITAIGTNIIYRAAG